MEHDILLYKSLPNNENLYHPMRYSQDISSEPINWTLYNMQRMKRMGSESNHYKCWCLCVCAQTCFRKDVALRDSVLLMFKFQCMLNLE